MSQWDVAEELRVSQQAISNWEAGRTLPGPLRLMELAMLYGTPTDMLLFGLAVVPVDAVDIVSEGACLPLDRARRHYGTVLRALVTPGHDSGLMGL